MRNHLSRVLWTGLVVLVAFATEGCGYSVRPPYDRSIKTVYVPMFRSQRFRRDLNIHFTELLQQEIRSRTPYTVVERPEGADARLEGLITLDDKNIVVESPNNLPRQLSTYMICTVTFTDNRSGVTTTKVTPPVMVGEFSQYFPEIGETTQLGFEKTMQKMAKDIVSMMEESWGAEYREDIDAPPVDPVATAEAKAEAEKARASKKR